MLRIYQNVYREYLIKLCSGLDSGIKKNGNFDWEWQFHTTPLAAPSGRETDKTLVWVCAPLVRLVYDTLIGFSNVNDCAIADFTDVITRQLRCKLPLGVSKDKTEWDKHHIKVQQSQQSIDTFVSIETLSAYIEIHGKST